MIRYISNIKKEYNDMIRVVIYNEPKPFLVPDNNIKRHKSQVGEDYEPTVSSLRRTRTLIRDIILCNDFNLFATFTFSPDKIYDRFSYYSCLSKITRWVHNQHEKSPDLIYIFVPERHKSGAWHFHALLGNFNGTMKKTPHKSDYGADIYNITAYRGGFTTACYFDNKDLVASYICKYISKDFIKFFNRRRFICSKNLNRPVKTINSRINFNLPHHILSEQPESTLYEFTRQSPEI